MPKEDGQPIRPARSPDNGDAPVNAQPRSSARRKSIISTTLGTLTNATTVEHRTMELMKQLNLIPTQAFFSIPSALPIPETRWIQLFPSLLVFARAGVAIRDAWRIYNNDPRYAEMTDRNERTLCVLSALAGGIVGLGGLCVNFLLQAQVGLLATAQAAVLTPIILSSLGIGCFCISLYRDLYRISKINEQLLTNNEEITINALKSRRRQLIVANIFEGIGTLGTILFISASIAALAPAAAAGFGSLLLISTLLLSVSAIPAAIELVTGAWTPSKNAVPPEPTNTSSLQKEKALKETVEHEPTITPSSGLFSAAEPKMPDDKASAAEPKMPDDKARTDKSNTP